MKLKEDTEFVHCKLCNSNDAEYLFGYEFDGVPLRRVKCKHCGLIYANPRLTKERTRQYFDSKYYTEDNIKYWFDSRISLFKDNLRAIERYSQKGRLLDVGCGLGFFMKIAKDNDWKTFGTEISDFGSSYAKTELGLNVFNGELRDANFPDDYFDVVTLWDVIYYLNEPREELMEIRRVLKKGGLLCLRVPIGQSFAINNWIGIRRILRHKTCPSFILSGTHDWLYIFSGKTITKMLKKTGFDSLKIRNNKPVLWPSLTLKEVALRKFFGLFVKTIYYLTGGICTLGPSINVYASK